MVQSTLVRLALFAAMLPFLFGGALAVVKVRPVMKVVRLLTDMKAELEKELADDLKVNEMLTCWCTKNDEEKTAAIEAGQTQIGVTKGDMATFTATMTSKKEERVQAQGELQKHRMSLDQAEALRAKENEEFHSQETFLLDAIYACNQTLIVLSEYHPELTQVRAAARRLHDAHVPQMALASGKSRKEQLDALQGFLRQVDGASSFMAIPVFRSYAPRTGQIYGILEQMLTDFKASLNKEQAAEKKAREDHAALVEAKTEEIKSAEKHLNDINADIAEFSKKYATAAKLLEETEKQLALDKAFLADLKQKCAESDEEFEARTKSRKEEIAAVGDTITILNDDTTFDVADKTVNSASFLQMAAITRQGREQQVRQRVAAVLQRAASRAAAPQLALVAASAKLDTFTKVKEEIDKLIAELNKQQQDEVMHRDWCIDEFASNKRMDAKAVDKQSNLQAKMEELNSTTSQLTKEIDDATAVVTELQAQMKRASEIREAENADHQTTTSDHRLMQAILLKAKERMAQVYSMLQMQGHAEPEPENQPGAAHIDTSGNHTSAGNGPARFTEYNLNARGSRVVGLLEEIIADSKKTEDYEMMSEKDAQVAYETFMKDSNKAIAAKTEYIALKTNSKVQAEQDYIMTKEDHHGVGQEIHALASEKGDLHNSCDFVLNNFGARQEARDAEVDALHNAKAILSGMQ